MAADALAGEIVEPLSRRVSARSRRATAGTRGLDVVAFVFYALGALVFWAFVITGGAVRWCWSAVALGWLEARESALTRGFDANRWPVRARERQRRGSG